MEFGRLYWGLCPENNLVLTGTKVDVSTYFLNLFVDVLVVLLKLYIEWF